MCKTLFWELGELQSTFRRADRESLKRVLTMREVTVRHPYARFDVTKPVLTSFLGTINNTGTGFLSDPTGNRRFVVVRSTVPPGQTFSDDWLGVDINQLWAQQWHEYQAGARGTLTADMRAYQNAMNDYYQQETPVTDLFNKYFIIDSFRSEPVTPDDPGGGVWNATEIVVTLQRYAGLRDSQKVNRTILAEHLLKLTGKPATNHRTINGRQKWGWRGIWMTDELAQMMLESHL